MKEQVFESLQHAAIPYGIFELANKLQLPIDELQTALDALVAEGRLAISKKGKYALPETLGLISARIAALRSGTLIALPSDGGDSMRVHLHSQLRCLPEDSVLVRPGADGECELVAICRRGRSEITAFIRIERQEVRRPRAERGKRKRPAVDVPRRTRIIGVPCDRRISCEIQIDGDVSMLKNDEIALLAIDSYPEGSQPMRAHVLRVLGDRSDMRSRLRAISEGHGFPTEFPRAVDQQSDALSSLSDEFAGSNREDLRDCVTFTIDGPFSKDFDDAVSLERLENGRWRLGVHIADVSHYVQPGSAIDREAQQRGTSLYLPGLTVPMLPEVLSNDLCSLLPDTDRLALSLFMDLHDGRITDHRLTRSVIHSRARLTYDAVNRLFEGRTDEIPADLQPILMDMRNLSHVLRSRRCAAGSIDLDLPEAEFTLDEENNPVDIFCAPRGEAERMIEDFMLAANETVAALAQSTGTPLIYRIHEEPDADRLHELELCLNRMNISTHIGEKPHPGLLQKVLKSAEELPSADVVRKMVLRSLKRAQYSERPAGHYALAMKDYCHFTSPIRRYPDLVVHRMMKRLLDGASTEDMETRMSELANVCSAREQESVLAEREADDIMKARYMQDHIGRKYYGVVSGVTAWGLYVTLPNTIEGLVHISTLDDYYDYDRERGILIGVSTGYVFKMGDHVRIRVEDADVDRGEIDFSIIAVEQRSGRHDGLLQRKGE